MNATIPDAQAEMERLGKFYEPNVYPGAGHGFLRQQPGREGANMGGYQGSLGPEPSPSSGSTLGSRGDAQPPAGASPRLSLYRLMP